MATWWVFNNIFTLGGENADVSKKMLIKKLPKGWRSAKSGFGVPIDPIIRKSNKIPYIPNVRVLEKFHITPWLNLLIYCLDYFWDTFTLFIKDVLLHFLIIYVKKNKFEGGYPPVSCGNFFYKHFFCWRQHFCHQGAKYN